MGCAPPPLWHPHTFLRRKYHQSAWKWHWKKFNLLILWQIFSWWLHLGLIAKNTPFLHIVTNQLLSCWAFVTIDQVHCSYWAVQRTYWKIIWVGLFSQFGVSVTSFPSPCFSLLCYLFFHSVIFLVCIQSNA